MSGWRDDRRRRDDRSSSGDFSRGRDRDRERSPHRSLRTEYRENRRSADRGRSPGSSSSTEWRDDRYSVHRRPSERSLSTSYAGITPAGEGLPDLPSTVEVPKNGAAFKVPEPPLGLTVGRPTKILVNHFIIQSLPVIKIHTYDIRMQIPPSSRRGVDPKVGPNQIIQIFKNAFWGENFIFDGTSSGWSTQMLMPLGKELFTAVDMTGHTTAKPNQVEVYVRNSGTVDVRVLVNYIISGAIDLDPEVNPKIESVLKWLNALFRKDPASRFVTRPKVNQYYKRSPKTTMPLRSTAGVLEALRGMLSTVQIRFGRLTMAVLPVVTAFWTPDKNLIELIHALTGNPPSTNIQTWYIINQVQFQEACQRLVGMFINVQHLAAHKNAKKMKLTRLSAKSAQKTEFVEKNGSSGTEQKTTVADYFARKYNIRLKYPDLPLASTNSGDFPLELCFSSAGERYKEVLQGAETADFIKFATAPAFVKEQQLHESLKMLRWHELKELEVFGISVSPNMLQLQGVTIPSPIPIFASGTDRNPPSMGAYNLRNKRFIQPCSIDSWALAYFPGMRPLNDGQLQDFCRKLQEGLEALGIRTPRAIPAFLRLNPQGDIKTSLTEIIGKTSYTFKAKPTLIFVLLHSPADRIYQIVKHVTEVHFGIASQVMLVEKATNPKGTMQYVANIAMKVCVKLGGANFFVKDPFYEKNKVMVMGGDISHPSPAASRMNPPPPSLSALVDSNDDKCVKFSSVTSAQSREGGTIRDLVPMAKELVKRYQHKNKTLPERVLYFRDGVSESELVALRETECQALKDLMNNFGPGIKVTVICCIKRHHTRLWPAPGEPADKLGNVVPGCCVQNSTKDKDFFLVSHAALQGMCRPTRYFVLLDDNNFTGDELMRITHGSTFSFQRATRSVSIVPAVYYADLVAEKAKRHILQDKDENVLAGVHPDLMYTMWWL